jgi:rubredoxin
MRTASPGGFPLFFQEANFFRQENVMKEHVRCKACGYLMDKDALGEVCPACGVKKEMFEPWEDKVGAARRMWLELHVHPIVVHLSNAFAPILLMLAVAYPLIPTTYHLTYFWPIIQFLTWTFPLWVLGSYVTGLVDGKVRYRKVTTPRLSQKMVLGMVFLVASVVQAVLVTIGNFEGPESFGLWLGYVIAAFVSLVIASVLGKWGSALFNAAMPGDKVFLGKKKKKPAAPAKPAAP